MVIVGSDLFCEGLGVYGVGFGVNPGLCFYTRAVILALKALFWGTT